MGTPSELFDKPSTTFVGYFIGAPAMNLFEAKVIGDHKVELDGHQIIVEPSLSKLNAGSLRLGVRAENMKLLNKKPKAGSNSLPIQVNRVDDFGNYKLVVGNCCGSDVKVKVDRDQELGSGSHFVSFDSNKACVYMNEDIVN